jgi:hypothetical protein
MKRQKIGFVHLPKTRGVSAIRAFSDVLGTDRCSTFRLAISEDYFEENDFVSGHVFIGDVTAQCYLFTLLRAPLEQIVSHLRWLDHYNLPEREGDLLGLPSEISVHVRRLQRVDFSQHQEIARFLSDIRESPLLKIRNVQAEMLAFSRASCRPVSDAELADSAIANLSRFSYVGLSETIDSDLARIFSDLGLGRPRVAHLNASPAIRTIDVTVPEIREALAAHVQADLILYNHVNQLRS